ncbi:MAG TPA: PAS domain-containing protein, partial [Gammaproteobacteria bacterium]|nr:PAS domain-containing protein [Gammaproteobacteria bacterium]
MFFLGLGLALVGVVVVEILIALDATPLGPVGWPSLGMIGAAGLGGLAGLGGGAVAVLAYYLVNLLHPERFEFFYSQASNTAAWFVGVALLCAGALAVRPRLLRLASAEAEIMARRKYEVALLESEEKERIARERLEMALDGSNVVLWDTDLRTQRVYLSEAWSRIVGRPEGDTVTTVPELFALLHPDEQALVRRTAVEVLKGERPAYAVEHRVRA